MAFPFDQVGLTPRPTTTLSTREGVSFRVLTTAGQFAVPYVELLDQYRETFGQEDRITSQRSCLCMWEQRYQFMADMLGTSRYLPGNIVGGVTTNINRFVPEQHPEIPFLYADTCDMAEALGVPTPDRENLASALVTSPQYGQLQQTNPASNMVSYNTAHFIVTYTPRDWDVFGDTDSNLPPGGELFRYVSRYSQTASENQQVPGTGFHFISDGTPIPEAGAITFSIRELTYLWRQVPKVPFAAIDSCVGKVNLYTFDNEFQPGTLVCLAPKLQRFRTGWGDISWNIPYVFVFRPAGWNALYRPHKGGGNNPPGFDPIIGNDNATPLIPSADFGTLFVLP